MPMDTIIFYNTNSIVQLYSQKISMSSILGKLLEKLYIIFFGKKLPKNLHISIIFSTFA